MQQASYELRSRLTAPTADAAVALLGCLLVHDTADGLTAGRIVETEAYLGPDDPASHAAMYRTERVAIMAGEPGRAYVYRSYGIHVMLNVVAHPPGETGAVLIRALEPVEGIEIMARRRGMNPDAVDPRALCSGPGKLAQALGVAMSDHGHDLLAGGRLFLAPGEPPDAVSRGGRIGITKAVDEPLRFWVTGNPHVSRRGGRS